MFKVKPMRFEITKHFLDPHSALVEAQCHGLIGQIGCQAPGFCLTSFPMDEQIDVKGITFCQEAWSQPDALIGPVNHVSETLPAGLRIQEDPNICFLSQNIEPVPFSQGPQDPHSAKLAVSDDENSPMFRKQPSNISQQSQLLINRTMPFGVIHPAPCKWDRSSSKSEANHQQLMSKANFCPVDNQSNFSASSVLLLQPNPGNGLIPCSDFNRRIGQKTAQASSCAQQLGVSRDFPSDAAQCNRSALIDADDQKDHISNARNPLKRLQFPNLANPSMIKLVGRHWFAPFLKFFRKIYFSGDSVPINYSFVKVSGG
jgi:hypothetical protein